ncbi:uncharacterized protein BX664DRAFT_332496 [Halteromyces radiatus]|uniref:uncharacterized protein n=1 Tax=Halteromyces radiatus TaxID=101107 RepID=UPI00221E4AF5|nr:uncharacterized protein BX664DRAFT_332496 [Halteromyces radiatus]KAI8089237.1 hypothetical protein BX664DRAFT_332496 [Halteromyces radiatus]
MKKITFTVSGTWNDFILWIRYIAQKYPNIESLDISSKQNYFTDRNILLEEIQSTIRLLFDSCRNLSSIRLDNVWWIDTFLLCYLDEEQRRSSSIEKVEISSSPYGLSTELFGLLSRSIIPLIKVLDITLCTQIINNPVLLSWGLRSGSMLTDLRISVSRNGSSPLSLLSIHWILESCPSLLSITLDSGFLDIVNDALTGLPPSTVQSHHLERLAVKNCTFNNEVWSYIEKKCPRLNWLSIDKGLLYDGSLFPSIQLKFPNHVFKSIIINRVRCPRMPVDVRPSPSFGSPIYNKPTWDEGWLPIEFMTIQRRQHPTLSACSDNNGVLSTQNDTIQQTFQALDMKFIDQRYNYNGNFTMTPQNLFGYFERLLQAKRLTAQGVLYYQRECKIPIPDPSSNNSTISSSSSKRRKFDRQKEQVRQKWEEQEQLANESTRFQRVQRRQQQHIPATDRGGHIFVDVYGVTDLIINEKWIILQGQ